MKSFPLPIDSVIPQLRESLQSNTNAVLEAPPGAGKTTKVPLALLKEAWLRGKKIILLEPRRLAARMAARRMAETLGEEVGETVGYRIRLESRISSKTRIEVITEGILTRLLQNDPSLEGAGLVIFDEFHERSIHADLSLALCLDSQAVLRPDLRLLVMSATLDGSAVSDILGGAPRVQSSGRSHPVETRHVPVTSAHVWEQTLLTTILKSLSAEKGSLLVFLPGAGEIRRTEERLKKSNLGENTWILPLFGQLSKEEQDRAVLPPPEGVRKVVLATSIAETSLTIEGVRVVIDSGYSRLSSFDPATGMSALKTVRGSRSSADQRRGRAGRTEPGLCFRLWREEEERNFQPFAEPEILTSDLAPLVLDLALWGVLDPKKMKWLDPPPDSSWLRGRDLLIQLGALTAGGQITTSGRQMAELPFHPRLAHMILKARELHCENLACEIAAILSERDFLAQDKDWVNEDLMFRLEVLSASAGRFLSSYEGFKIHGASLRRVWETAEEWKKRFGSARVSKLWSLAGILLAFAYPDRIAARREGKANHFILREGRGMSSRDLKSFAESEFVVAGQMDAGETTAKMFLGSRLDRKDLEEHFLEQIVSEESIHWDGQNKKVLGKKIRRLGSCVVEEKPLSKLSADLSLKVFLEGIRQEGLSCLPWTQELRQWQNRVLFLRRREPLKWPDLSEDALLRDLEEWLAPFLGGMQSLKALAGLDLKNSLHSLLSYEKQRLLDRLAPAHLTVPSGSQVRVDYESGEEPVLAVRLQELFGLADTPRIADGKVPLLLHLLSPARRPVQVTKDLASFWKNAYFEVKKDLKARYPRHYWPDDPMQAEATSGVRKKTRD